MLGITPAAVDAGRGDLAPQRRCSSNIGQEVNLAQAVKLLGAEQVKDLQYFQGGDPNITPDPAIDLALINGSILEIYNAFRRPLQFGAGAPRRGAVRARTEPAERRHRQQQLGGRAAA